MLENYEQQQTPMKSQSSGSSEVRHEKNQHGGRAEAQTGNPSGGSSGGGEGKSTTSTSKGPDEVLAELKQKLEKDQIQNEKNKTEKLQADIAQLEKLLKDNKTAGDEYEKKYQELKKEWDFLDAEYEDMKKGIDATVPPEEKAKVDGARQAVDQKLSEWDTTVSNLEGEAKESVAYSEKELKTKQQALLKSQEDYEKEKNLLKRIGDNFKKMKDYKKSEEDEDSKGNKKRMYFYFLESVPVHDQTKGWLKEVDKHKADLNDKWLALQDAKKAVREAEGELNSRKAALDLAKKNSEAGKKTRTTDILDKVS